MNKVMSMATIAVLTGLYLVFIVLFGVLIRFWGSKFENPGFVVKMTASNLADKSPKVANTPEYQNSYLLFQNVNVMVFIGFGFLMTHLKKYGCTSLAFSFLLSCFVIMWHVIIDGLINLSGKHVLISVRSFMRADLAAVAFLISFGVVLGKFNILQFYLMAFLETAIYVANKYLLDEVLLVSDPGGSMGIHLFGAFFGLGLSVIHRLKGGPTEYKTDLEKSSYESDVSAMIGTTLLWVFWPALNAILVSGFQRYRSIINTYIALASSSIAVFIFTIAASRKNDWKLNMIYIQNATLAAGVAVGSFAHLNAECWEAMLLGLAGGGFSVAGYCYIQDYMTRKLRIHDTSGIFSLHGLPGFIGGVAAAIVVYKANTETYGNELYLIYPAMISSGKNRKKAMQGVLQLCSVFISMCIGFIGGLITGALVVLGVPNLTEEERFKDEIHWESYENS